MRLLCSPYLSRRGRRRDGASRSYRSRSSWWRNRGLSSSLPLSSGPRAREICRPGAIGSEPIRIKISLSSTESGETKSQCGDRGRCRIESYASGGSSSLSLVAFLLTTAFPRAGFGCAKKPESIRASRESSTVSFVAVNVRR